MDWKKQVAEFSKGLNLSGPNIMPQAVRVGLFGSVGSGKSVTSLIFAIGITPEGKIGVVDCENHRSALAIQIAARMAAKHYNKPVEAFLERFNDSVVYLEPPFHPLRAVAAMDRLEQIGCKTILFDGITSIWEAEGGYLDLKNDEVDRMLNANPNSSEAKVAQSAAAHVKPWTHQKFVNRLNNSTASVVMCIQAKKKWDAATKQIMAYETPIQESGFTRNFVVVGAVEPDQEGKGGLTDFTNVKQGCKFTDPNLLALLPKKGERFTFAHGEAVLKWCQTPQGPGTEKPKPAKAPDARGDLLRQLRDATVSIHGWKQGDGAEAWATAKEKLNQWVIDESGADAMLDAMTEDQLRRTLSAATEILNKPKTAT